MCCLSRVLPVWRSFETEVLFDKSLAFWVWACYNEQETTRESEAFFVNVLLTSCGLETPAIEKQFLSMLPKPMEAVTAMFIPTAAVDPDAIEVLPKCLNDLLMCGIQRKNIFVNDLHTPLTGEIKADVVYLCGGNTEYLLRRINEQSFRRQLLAFINRGGVVLGVSAGSIIFSASLPDNLGLLSCPLHVHCENCENPGKYPLDWDKLVHLGNEQAIILGEKHFTIIE